MTHPSFADGFAEALRFASYGYWPLLALGPLAALVAFTTPNPVKRVQVLALPIIWIGMLAVIASVQVVPTEISGRYLPLTLFIPIIQLVAHIASLVPAGARAPRLVWGASNLLIGVRVAAYVGFFY